jgi:fumarate reductase subunit C
MLLQKRCGDATSDTHPDIQKKKNAYTKSVCHFVLLPIFNCNTFLCNAAILFGTLLFHFVTYQTAKPKSQSIAIKKTVIPTTTIIPLLQYKNCQKHT